LGLRSGGLLRLLLRLRGTLRSTENYYNVLFEVDHAFTASEVLRIVSLWQKHRRVGTVRAWDCFHEKIER
jgi:hypothetical protein